MTAKLAFAWLVHLYTALGAVVAFVTIVLIEQLKFQEAFWLMSLAVVIDATDGTLARAARVKELIPQFDGDRLEDIIDYANYVVVPCWFLLHANLLPAEDSLWLVSLPLLASAYGFCQKEAKTSDNFFLGFPSYWNIMVFYFFALQSPPWINAFGILWGLAVLAIIYLLPEPPLWLVSASLLFPAYYTALSFWLAFRRVPS